MGITPLDLFRSGNASGPRLDRVRINIADPDVDTYVDQAGTTWVVANGKGVSSWDAPDPSWRGKPWRLPRGETYSDLLLLWNDDPGHWTWVAAADMPLVDYEEALRVVGAKFVPA
jgi:hypothetical protein